MSRIYRVALLGFSEFERKTLASCLRLATRRHPGYALLSVLDESDLVLADADHASAVQLVTATDRLGQTVFIGSQAPADAVAWLMRPIDPLQVMRALDAMVLAAGEAEVPAPPAPPAPLNALLVDDSPTALLSLSSLLQPWGLVVECVGNSGQAIERLAQRAYDFVFLGVELGPDSDLDGLALCQHIKRDHPLPGSVVVVMVSAKHSQLDRVRGTLAGCDACLDKPLQAAELERLLLRQGLKAPAPAPTAAAPGVHPA